MSYDGKVSLSYRASHRHIGAGAANLELLDDGTWKGTLGLSEIDDHNFLVGKTGDHFEIVLEDTEGRPRLNAVVRQIAGLNIELTASDPAG